MIAEWLGTLTEREKLAAYLSLFTVVMCLASLGLGWWIGDRGARARAIRADRRAARAEAALVRERWARRQAERVIDDLVAKRLEDEHERAARERDIRRRLAALHAYAGRGARPLTPPNGLE